jgi:diguanylate cyclase (GGDEF)-like protein
LLTARTFTSSADRDPLTKLPGNTSIQQAVERALGTPMAVCYIDINNFKPYNYAYGFSLGDEVIRMVARRITSNTVKESKGDGFVGEQCCSAIRNSLSN